VIVLVLAEVVLMMKKLIIVFLLGEPVTQNM